MIATAPFPSAGSQSSSGTERHRLGEFLVRQALITEAQLQSALRIQDKYQGRYKLGEILVQQKVLPAVKLREILEIQRRLRVTEQESRVALPPLPASIQDIAVVDNRIVYVAQGQQGRPAFQSWLHDAKRDCGTLVVTPCDMNLIAQLRNVAGGDNAAGTANLSVIRQIRRIFADAVRRRASDVHFTLSENGGNGYLDVQYRVNGDVSSVSQFTEELGASMIGALFQGMATVADAQVTDNDDQNAIITHALFLRGDDGADLGLTGVRLAKSRLVRGKGVAARLLYRQTGQRGKGDTEDRVSALDHLGYSPRQIASLTALTRKTVGINLFTGPTGSGKTTTLSAQIRDIRVQSPGLRILTIEDPVEVEYNDPHIWQFYVANANTDEEKSALFASKVKACLREDPDIIMIGEIRGLETAREAVNAAVTGHQLWTTLHVTDPFMIALRLVLMGIDKFYLRDPQLLSSLIAQRLVKTPCPHCAIPLKGHEDQVEGRLLDNLRTWVHNSPASDLSLIRLDGKGCEACDYTGKKGRTVIAQVIAADEELLGWMIDEGPAVSRRRYMARANAEVDMMAHGVLKVLTGEVDPRAVEEKLEIIPPRPATLRALLAEDV